jgi:hypothetical protein
MSLVTNTTQSTSSGGNAGTRYLKQRLSADLLTLREAGDSAEKPSDGVVGARGFLLNGGGLSGLLFPFPDYLPLEKYCRLSYPAQQKVNDLLLNPPKDTEGYLKRKDRFTALGYRSQQHYLITRYLEHLEYDSDVDDTDGEGNNNRTDQTHQ